MVVETGRVSLCKSIKGVEPANEPVSNLYQTPIAEPLSLCSAPSEYLPSPSSSSSSSPSLSVSTSAASSPSSSLQQAVATKPSSKTCQSNEPNPSTVFHQNHPMLGLSAEEDAEFKRSVCSDDNDNTSGRLDNDQVQDNNIEEMSPQSIDTSVNQIPLQEMKVDNPEQVAEVLKVNNEPIEEQTIELRLLVRRREAGALIGKRGSNIKRLRENFRSSMFSIPDTGNGPERVVCIKTDKGSIDAILEDLTQLLVEKSPEKDKQIELKLLIHSSHAGSIIGIGGQSIKKLRNDSKAAIKIYEMCCPLSNERVCAIKAKPPVVTSTIKLIQTILNENPIKGTIKPYDALHFDLNLVEKYGGYLPDEGVEMLANHQYHHHHDSGLAGYTARHHVHETYPAAVPKHYSIWRPPSQFPNPCELMYENSRELGHRTISDTVPTSCPVVDHQHQHQHHHHHQLATDPQVVNLDAIRSKASTGIASFAQLDQHGSNCGRAGSHNQDCSGDEQKGSSIHTGSHSLSCGAISSTRPNRFHPYAQQMANRASQLPDPYPFNAGPQAILRHHHQQQQQQQQQQQLSSPIITNAPYTVPSRLHYQQQTNVLTIQHHAHHRNHHQFMRASNVYPPNNIADSRSRHVRPCLCMLLPMNHHHHHSDHISSTAPLFQLVKNFNHQRSPGIFNNGANSSNNNSNNSGNNVTDNSNNNANTNNKKNC